MIARKLIPEEYAAWNRKHGAPFGREREKRQLLKNWVPQNTWLKWRGPFALQTNNSIRAFEYPWAWHASSPKPGMRAIEIGGGLSGFQFALNQAGVHVVNLDPGMGELGWEYSTKRFNELNRLFKTEVKFIPEPVETARLEAGSFDRIFCISVLEHLSFDAASSILNSCSKLLSENGRLIVTLDLFLNLIPFTGRTSNEYGENLNVKKLVDASDLSLIQGDPKELFGYPEFDATAILSGLEDYLVGNYPALSQCFVLEQK